MSNMNTEELNAIWQIMLKTIRADKLISEAASELWFKRFRLDDRMPGVPSLPQKTK